MALRCYWAIIEKGGDGFYAFLPDVPGATAAGTNRSAFLTDSALRHLRELQPEFQPADSARSPAGRGLAEAPASFTSEKIEVPAALFDWLGEQIARRRGR